MVPSQHASPLLAALSSLDPGPVRSRAMGLRSKPTERPVRCSLSLCAPAWFRCHRGRAIPDLPDSRNALCVV